MYFFNIVLAALSFVAFVLPFLAPKLFPILSVLTLLLPSFLVINVFFFLYWLLQFKRQVILSLIVLLLGITFVNKYYKFSSIDLPKEPNDFTVMSYNVRLFNLFKWVDKENVGEEILNFVNEQRPDILCIQEYSTSAKVQFRLYHYQYFHQQGKKIKTSQAIFSKFPILNEGVIELPESNNSVIFVDIRKGKDTIRVYNIHLESIKISPDVTELEENVESINQEKSEQVFIQISQAFKKQQIQAELISQHKLTCDYPIIICGDMNNSAFSYVYRNIKGTLNDCFEEAGNGFGQTYHFKYYPARIDYIFADESMEVKSFKNFPKFDNSDHYPIITRLSFKE
jgi:endonuclease/exonuclease/phosphatase family metal-dependent hydrolase